MDSFMNKLGLKHSSINPIKMKMAQTLVTIFQKGQLSMIALYLMKERTLTQPPVYFLHRKMVYTCLGSTAINALEMQRHKSLYTITAKRSKVLITVTKKPKVPK